MISIKKRHNIVFENIILKIIRWRVEHDAHAEPRSALENTWHT